MLIVKTIRNINKFCEQNSELYFLKTGGAYSDRWVLKELKPNMVLLEIIYTNSVHTSQESYYISAT
jgi:hypothetical protein